MTLQDLSDLKYQDSRARYPNAPSYAVPRTRYTDATANDLTRAIADYLQLQGHHVERVNTTGIQRKVNGRMRWTHGGGRKGSADIHSVVNGRMIAIEIKHGRDQQSEAQQRYQTDIERAGGVYLIVKTWEDFIEQFKMMNNE